MFASATICTGKKIALEQSILVSVYLFLPSLLPIYYGVKLRWLSFGVEISPNVVLFIHKTQI